MDLKMCFKMLDLDPPVDPVLANRAYKNQVRRWHPDQFPEGSAAQAAAEERLKQINIAYDRIKPFLTTRAGIPDAAAETPSRPLRDAACRSEPSGKTAAGRSWVGRLFEALKALAAYHTAKPPAAPAGAPGAGRPKTFGQVLDEMTGGMSPKPNKRAGSPDAASRRRALNLRARRRASTSVGVVGEPERPGPVKPVGRVRGIGRSR